MPGDRKVYLNHAATTYPKPPAVIQGVADILAAPPVSQYRSASASYRSASETGGKEDLMKLCRRNLAQLFEIPEAERIFFTSGSTQALNMAILGLRPKRRKIILTAAEHNSVLRPVYNGLLAELESGRYEAVVIPCDESGYVDLGKMEQAVDEDTALVVVNHSSNVTGALQDMAAIGRLTRNAGALLLADVSQSGGMQPVSVTGMNIDMLCFTAHKGLLGIEGLGGLYVRPGIDLKPLLYGGTGTDSSVMIPKEPFYEVGTANIPGIAGLNAGIEYIKALGMETIITRQAALMDQLWQGLSELPGIKVYAAKKPAGCVLSFNLKGLAPADLGYILAGTYGIVVRTGLHCSPLIHDYIGSGPAGTVRVSISCLTEPDEISYLIEALQEISVGIGEGSSG